MAVTNLWGEIPENPVVRPPGVVLKEQGDLLETLTKGLLECRISRDQDGNNSILRFAIIAPALNNYAFVLLQVNHDIELYPAYLKAIADSGSFLLCNDEEEFVKGLANIFQSVKTKKVIAGLLAQIQQGV